jgi:hypothetical protein
MPGQWVRNALWRSAKAVPSLDLRFADSKSLVDSRTGQSLITFTRASSATFIDSAGTLQTAAVDVPRFDHNPTTGESLGLLVEEARTNLLVRSEEFDNASWSKVLATVTANQTTAPDGTSNADKLIGNATLDGHYVQQNISGATSGISYTSAVFAKASELTRFELLHAVGSTLYAQGYDLSNGTLLTRVTAGTTAATGGFIQAVGNGWYRCGITQTSDGTTGAVRLTLRSGNSVAFDATSQGAFFWGAQLEVGAFATSYIPTTTAAATRSADVASITGANFSSWYRQDEGTIYYDGTVSQGLAVFPWFYNITDGTINNSIGVYQYTNGIYGGITAGGTSFTPDPSVLFSPVSGAAAKHALAVKTSDTRASYNGTLSSAQTSTVMPVVNQLAIGQRVTGNRMTGTIRRLTYWPQRLPNSTLVALTQ